MRLDRLGQRRRRILSELLLDPTDRCGVEDRVELDEAGRILVRLPVPPCPHLVEGGEQYLVGHERGIQRGEDAPAGARVHLGALGPALPLVKGGEYVGHWVLAVVRAGGAKVSIDGRSSRRRCGSITGGRRLAGRP